MFFKKPEVLFRTDPELYGIIPEPVPSRSYIPDWYKKLIHTTRRKEMGYLGKKEP